VLVDGAGVGRAAPLHQLDALERLQRTNQYRSRVPVRFSDGIHQMVDAVVQVDVGKTRRAEQRLAARRAPE